jgi:hypothetical protein
MTYPIKGISAGLKDGVDAVSFALIAPLSGRFQDYLKEASDKFKNLFMYPYHGLVGLVSEESRDELDLIEG